MYVITVSCYLLFLQIRANEEVGNLTVIVKSVVQHIVVDLRNIESVPVMSSSTPAATLVHHLHTQGWHLLKEVLSDQLLLDIIHSIQSSINVTRYVFLNEFFLINSFQHYNRQCYFSPTYLFVHCYDGGQILASLQHCLSRRKIIIIMLIKY